MSSTGSKKRATYRRVKSCKPFFGAEQKRLLASVLRPLAPEVMQNSQNTTLERDNEGPRIGDGRAAKKTARPSRQKWVALVVPKRKQA